MRAAILARVSDATQAADDRLSLDAQVRAMKARCDREGWTVVREYRAEGESAFTSDLAKRPTMARVMVDAAAGAFDVLVVHESSRLARNERLAHEIIERLELCGARLVNAGSQVDYHSPEGRMFYAIESDLNAYWSRKMGSHIRKSKTERFEQGLPVGQIPFGYQKGETTKCPPVPVPDEAAALRAAFRDRALGRSYGAIMDDWSRAGLRPRSRQGYSLFTVSSVQSILENPFYYGMIVHRGELRQGRHEPIVTEEEWQAAQLVVRRTRRVGSLEALLVGIATCALCRGPIWTTATGQAGRRVPMYREPAHLQHRDCGNSRTMWNARRVDTEVTGIIVGMGLDEHWLESVGRMARRMPQGQSSDREALEEQKRRATNAYLAGALAESEWRSIVEHVDGRLAVIPKSVDVITLAGERLTEFAQVWDVSTLDERREACRILFKDVPLDTRSKRLWVEPRPEYAPLFDLRRRYVLDLPPAGIEPAHMV